MAETTNTSNGANANGPNTRAKRRRAWGDGYLRERPDGRHELRIKMPGETKVSSFYGKTASEATRNYRKALKEAEQGRPRKPSTELLKDHMAGWLEESIRPNIDPSTYASYEQSIRVHIAPTIGMTPLAKLTADDVERWRNRLLASGKSPRTVQYAYDLLRRALTQAVRRKKIGVNVAADVDRPRVEREEVVPLSPEEAGQLLEAIKGHRLEGVLLVAMGTGLRQGEVLGLRWQENIDFQARVIRVQRQLQEGELIRTKRPRSVRTIPMPSFVYDALKSQEERQDLARKAAGDRWKESGLVFTSTVGTPLDGKNTTHRFQAILVKAGIRHQRFHDLRHACASLLLAQGVHPRVVMDILGHTSLDMTMGIYSHSNLALQREAMDRMDLAFAGIKKGSNQGSDKARGPAIGVTTDH
jgi:integrase